MTKTIDDVIDTLFDGNKEDIENVKCPNCNGTISYALSDDMKSMTVRCIDCGESVHMGKLIEKPNCFEYFGLEHKIN